MNSFQFEIPSGPVSLLERQYPTEANDRVTSNTPFIMVTLDFKDTTVRSTLLI